MNRHVLVTALVITLVATQLAGTAQAGTYAYDVPIGMEEAYLVTGSNPRLDESVAVGDAEISRVDDLGFGVKRVWVHCLETSLVDCTGNILTN